MANHDLTIELRVDGVPVLWDATEVEGEDVTSVLILLAAHVLVMGHDLDELSTVRRDKPSHWEFVDPRKMSVFEILEVLLHGTEDEQRLLRMRIDAARMPMN